MRRCKMFARTVKTEININVSLDEPLTSDACVKLVIELLKYILYQKQQIPLTYDALAQFQTKLKPTDRRFSSIKSLQSTLKNIAEELLSQFVCQTCNIRAVVISIGATIITPKLCIRLELPALILNGHAHFGDQHSSKKPLLSLIRSVTECSEFQEALSLPLNPTNTFVLLQKSDSMLMSEFFLPKPEYVPERHKSTGFRIKFEQDEEIETQCTCSQIVSVFRDLPESIMNENSNVQRTKYCGDNDAAYKWYQSREVIKGFKFI